MLDDFAVFILTHGRPNKVITYDTLRRRGYTGPIYIIIDNEDKTADTYRRIYGDKVIVFDKAAIAKTFDEGDNFGDRRAVIYARNVSFQIARDLGLRYFLQLDDDYNGFEYRINHEGQYPKGYRMVQGTLDGIIEAYLSFYQTTAACSIAMAQGGDFFSGADEMYSSNRKRKCMNTFFCSVDRPFQFVGRINEDVNTYVWFQMLGNLFLTVPFVSVKQLQTQSNTGGMTEMYLDSGTFIKSFYTVMYAPSCTLVKIIGEVDKRLHHSIKWANAVPCIVPETCRKASGNSEITVSDG
jgi:hypothetical protein